MKSKDRTINRKLKDKLLTEMTRQGLNGQRLAQRSQVSDSEISRILSGQSTPGLENAFRLARAIGVSLDYLADDSLESDPVQESDSLSADERRVLDLSARIGLSRTLLLLENISFLGYELAMHRLLETRLMIEPDLDSEPRNVAPPNASPANHLPSARSGTAG